MGETTWGEEWNKRETDGACVGGREQRSWKTCVPRFTSMFLFNHFLPTPASTDQRSRQLLRCRATCAESLDTRGGERQDRWDAEAERLLFSLRGSSLGLGLR